MKLVFSFLQFLFYSDPHCCSGGHSSGSEQEVADQRGGAAYQTEPAGATDEEWWNSNICTRENGGETQEEV